MTLRFRLILQAKQGISNVGGPVNQNGTGRQEIFYMHVPANKTGLVIGRGKFGFHYLRGSYQQKAR